MRAFERNLQALMGTRWSALHGGSGRGDLQIASWTAGASPALAHRLRKEINAQLPLDAGEWLNDLGKLRREVTQMEPLNEERKWLLHQLAQREVCGYEGCPSRLLARQHALTNPLPSNSFPTNSSPE